MCRMGWRHLLWDLGGTMIDTYPSVDATLAGVCAAHGSPVEVAEVSRLTRGSIGGAIEELGGRLSISAAAFAEAYAALKQSWRKYPPPVMPGARALIARVRELGGLNLVVTHRDRGSATTLLQAHDLLVDDLLCAPDGYPRKPDPAMYRTMLRRHGVTVDDCLAVGDRAIDAQAADAIGMAWARLAVAGSSGTMAGGLQVTDLHHLLPRLR